jgi:hypothetical protein
VCVLFCVRVSDHLHAVHEYVHYVLVFFRTLFAYCARVDGGIDADAAAQQIEMAEHSPNYHTLNHTHTHTHTNSNQALI